MKLLIEGEYKEVGFWSFLKCNLITSLVIPLIFWGIALAIILIVGTIILITG